MFEPINKWPDKDLHLRNIKVALEVAAGNNYKVTGTTYNLSQARVSQIYRVLMAMLCERRFKIKFKHAILDKSYYNHPDRLEMILEYFADFVTYYYNKTAQKTNIIL